MKERYRVKAFVHLGNQTAEVNLIVDSPQEAKKLAEKVETMVFVETELSHRIVYDTILGIEY